MKIKLIDKKTNLSRVYELDGSDDAIMTAKSHFAEDLVDMEMASEGLGEYQLIKVNDDAFDYYKPTAYWPQEENLQERECRVEERIVGIIVTILQ